EPLRNHQLGGGAARLAAIVELDAGANESLRRVCDRRGAKAERNAQRDRALVELDRDNAKFRCGHRLRNTMRGDARRPANPARKSAHESFARAPRTARCPSWPACAAAATICRRLR